MFAMRAMKIEYVMLILSILIWSLGDFTARLTLIVLAQGINISIIADEIMCPLPIGAIFQQSTSKFVRINVQGGYTIDYSSFLAGSNITLLSSQSEFALIKHIHHTRAVRDCT